MYFVKYGDRYLHDPRVGTVLPTATLETEINASDYFKFTIAPDSDLHAAVREHDQDNLVTVWSDGECIFRGEIYRIQEDFHRVKTCECRGELAYLNDSMVRPYSTIEGEASRTAPSSVNGYFEFLVREHNSQVDGRKSFSIGRNEGARLDANNYIYRSDSNYPSVGETMKSKLVDMLGGYLVADYGKDAPCISYLADFPTENSQVIDLGVNLLDFLKDNDSSEVATFVIPVGAKKEQSAGRKSEDDASKISEKVTIDGEPDGEFEAGYVKQGDIVYSVASVEKYGWIGALAEFDDVTIPRNLVSKGVSVLKSLESPKVTIEVKAIDLSMIKPGYDPITAGQYVRVRSRPYGFDSFMLCCKVDYDLVTPSNNTFTLGNTFDTLTNQQSVRINAINASVNKTYERAVELSSEAKAAADNAQSTADAAANDIKNMTPISIDFINSL